jgi:hypothetical protein
MVPEKLRFAKKFTLLQKAENHLTVASRFFMIELVSVEDRALKFCPIVSSIWGSGSKHRRILMTLFAALLCDC